MKKEILKVLVGSRAHGLANKNSDYDYRGVFIYSTSEILKLGNKKIQTTWVEGKEDDTSWELSHFLTMAVKSNPTILETFLAPIKKETKIGKELRTLFPYVWNSTDVYNAFLGYGHNQRKKFLDKKDNRQNKFAVAFLRVLYNGVQLLETGTFDVKIGDHEIGKVLKEWKDGKYNIGEVIQLCEIWEEKLKLAYDNNPDKKTNIDKINKFLLKVRKENW